MKETCRFLKFIFFSILATLFELFVLNIICNYIYIGKIFKNILSLIIYVFIEFKLNKKFTFESDIDSFFPLVKLYLFYIIYFIISNIIFAIFGESTYVLAIIMIINIIVEFLYQKYFVFNGKIDNKLVKIK